MRSTFFQESTKRSNDGHDLFPVLLPIEVLCKGVSWLDTAGDFAEGCSDTKLCSRSLRTAGTPWHFTCAVSEKAGLNRPVGRT